METWRNNGYFRVGDQRVTQIPGGVIEPGWWSRGYEYPWALEFAGSSQVVADMGCGWMPRPFKDTLAMLCKHVYAVDIDSRLFELPRMDHVTMVQADFSRRVDAILDESLDLVFCISVLEDLGERIPHALAEFRRCLAPWGAAVITFDVWYDERKPLGKYPGLKLADFRDYVSRAGLQFDGEVIEDKAGAELPSGGISAWQNQNGGWNKAYPEVTGYMIPSLINWGEWDMAMRCADWLVSVQNPDGSFDGLDGGQHTFDTAAALEGLMAVERLNKQRDIQEAWKRARSWIMRQAREDGTLRRTPALDDTAAYTMRASAIVQEAGELRQGGAIRHWMNPGNWGRVFRPHYAAYCLEGLWRAGEYAFVRLQLERSRMGLRNNRLMPMTVNPDWTPAEQEYDVCATAQFGLLYAHAGMPYQDILATLNDIAGVDGLILGTSSQMRPSWTAKFYLDLVYYAIND